MLSIRRFWKAIQPLDRSPQSGSRVSLLDRPESPCLFGDAQRHENRGRFALCADRADVLSAVAHDRAPFFRRINEDTPAFQAS
jgi:hypothetical protein